jgi:hypothetical protein
MGQWLKPDHAVMLAHVVSSPRFGVPGNRRGELIRALAETGFLVSSAYYVPDVEELFAMERQLAEVDYHGRGRVPRSWIRWVMCGETQIELHRRHGNQKTMHTPNLSDFLSTGDLTEPDRVLDEMHMVMTTRAAASIPAALDAGRLFDMPIRRDPAARRPLFELIPEDERRS